MENSENTQIITSENEGTILTPGQTPRSSWKFSTDKIRKCIATYAADDRQVLVDTFMWCIKNNIGREELGEKVGYSGNTLFKVYTGTYYHPETGARMGPPAKMIRAMRDFLSAEKTRVTLGEIDFVETPTAKKVITACKLARESQTPVFIYGNSHIGKTWALEHYTFNMAGGRAIYVAMKAATGLLGMIHRIAEASGISPKGNKEDLIQRIKKALAANQILIIDELHKLRNTYSSRTYFTALEVLREIYDEVKCGMVLCGTDLFKRSMSEEKNGELEQLYRRGVHKFILPPYPTMADVKAIITHHGLEWPERDMKVRIGKIVEQPFEILWVKSREEGLKAVTERIRYARKMDADGRVTWESFVKAHLSIMAEDQSDTEGGWN